MTQSETHEMLNIIFSYFYDIIKPNKSLLFKALSKSVF